jgi:hypothetical protein
MLAVSADADPRTSRLGLFRDPVDPSDATSSRIRQGHATAMAWLKFYDSTITIADRDLLPDTECRVNVIGKTARFRIITMWTRLFSTPFRCHRGPFSHEQNCRDYNSGTLKLMCI